MKSDATSCIAHSCKARELSRGHCRGGGCPAGVAWSRDTMSVGVRSNTGAVPNLPAQKSWWAAVLSKPPHPCSEHQRSLLSPHAHDGFRPLAARGCCKGVTTWIGDRTDSMGPSMAPWACMMM